jgi:SsrA-binding protein
MLLPKTFVLLLLLLALSSQSGDSFLLPSLSPSRLATTSTTISSPGRGQQKAVSTVALFLAKSGKKKKKKKDTTICVNRVARRNYEVLEILEAGISLLGTEVKSIRDGKMNLRDGFVKTSKNGRSCTLMNVHIGKHAMSAAYFQHDEKRPRELLIHANEARRLLSKTEQTGMTIVPLKAYFNDDNKVKIQIALCRGKNVRDKREDIKARDGRREDNRIIKNFRI